MKLVIRYAMIEIVLLVFVFSFFTRPAHAGGVVGDGTPGSCTEAALNTALVGGGTVTFNCGGPKTILITSQKTIAQNTVIQGGGVITITGGLATRLFQVIAPASLTLNDITLDSGFSTGVDSGGAIYSNGMLSLSNVTVQNSQTGPNLCGGAIFANGVVSISNSRFSKNTADYAGGAICTGSNLITTTVQITNSSFSNNKAVSTAVGSGKGGAIFVNFNGGNMTVIDSAFNGNSAQYGGALYIDQGGTATLRTQNTTSPTYFLSNYATDSGGAVLNIGSLSVYGVQFNGNTAQNIIAAGYGGAVANLGALTLSDSSFSLNSGRFGGALLVGETFNIVGNARADVQRTTFFKNTAGVFGGGLYINASTAVMTVTNSVFNQNTAASGGGAARFNAHLEIANSSFTSNQSTGGDGGGLWLSFGPNPPDPTLVRVTSVTFSGNTASSNRGGGIYNQGYSLLKNITFKDNTNGIFNAGTTHLGNSVLDNPGSLNCDGTGTPISSDGHNLSTDNSCAVEINATAAQLGPLTTNNNGVNHTDYHMPLTGSPLINAATGCPTLDQRGAMRPDACDIGAVEYGGLIPQAYMPLIIK